ncbi:fatty acid desaturase [Microbulbifer variabilis]|uniref:Fatty acid desaturase n=1 Tax=Microbulbifer variabilis TaxID=266805 RepID=A0ABY4VJ12_9GAMM|nr:fatty acid desaturase [Microbulbifer variabilis]USD22442.1 fatty acid desaturase [Microbulbifer variabilis]
MNTASPTSTTKRKCFWVPTVLFASTGFLALTAVPIYGLMVGYHWYQWLAFALLAALCSLSVTAGNHRLWSHRSYKAHWSLRLFFALFSAAALQNSTLTWSAAHRLHHRHIDDNDRDPYSAMRGFWFSHIDWMMHEYPSSHLDYKNVGDLKRDKIVMWQHNHYIPITLSMNLGIPLALGLLTGDVIGMLLLAGVLRIVVNHHTTFLVNSLAHMWGKRPYKNDISARDNIFLNLLVFGEGYHNYHHAFPADYRNGVGWFAYDPTKWMIKLFSWIGITNDLKTPSAVQIQKAKLSVQFSQAEEKLGGSAHREDWLKLLENEAIQFARALENWKNLQLQRAQCRGDKIAEKWRSLAIQNKVKELEFGLKMQSRRLSRLIKQCQTDSATSS